MKKRTTIIPTFSDIDRMRSIFRICPDAKVYAKQDHQIIYIDCPLERFVSAERWSMKPDKLADFMALNGPEYSYVSPSSFAMSLYKKHFQRFGFVMPGAGYRQVFCRRAVYGGRCEVYKYGKHHLYQYDINMSYPHSATKLTFPDASSVEYTAPSIDNIWRYEGASLVTFSQDGDIPILPLRYMQRVVYAKAEMATGCYSHTELRYAMDNGVRVHSVEKQYIARKNTEDNPFEAFVQHCYELRHITGDKIWKTICVSLFGRLGTMNSGLLIFRAARSRDELREKPRYLKDYFGASCVATEMKSPPDSNPLWAAMILAHARIKLHEKINIYDTYYIDTDCVMRPRADRSIQLSDAIGGFKLKEGEYDIKGAKQYTYQKDGASVPQITLKGVSTEHRNMKDFMAARYTQERLLNDDGLTTRPYEITGAMLNSYNA